MNNYAQLTPVPGGVKFTSTYDARLVSALKSRIPGEARKWDKGSKAWLVDARYAAVCADIAWVYLGVSIAPPTQTANATTEMRIVKLEYLGRCKDRDGDQPTAFGYCDGSWSLIFPETVLKSFFEAIPDQPDAKATLYGTLLIAKSATLNEIRAAYRRLAKQLHPDVCHEEDAAEKFKRVNFAYSVLSDETTRRKYDAGLALAATAHKSQDSLFGLRRGTTQQLGYQPPLRCGWVMGEGVETLGRFAFSKIIDWKDIEDAQGRVMVSSWPKWSDSFVVTWS